MRPFDGAARRLLSAPRVAPEEGALGPALDALGGEVVRLRSRDGLRLTGRWLEDPGSSGGWGRGASPPPSESEHSLAAEGDSSAAERFAAESAWIRDPHEAILVLHGYSGSVAPDLVEYGPFLCRTAGVLGLDFRGHGGSDPGPTTFGVLEVEDVAGALAWLGERGITRVALFGTSMGAITAIEAVAILGDGRLAQADDDPSRPTNPPPPPRPLIVGVVADSAAPELATAIASRTSLPFAGRLVANLVLDAASKQLGADPRTTEPARVAGLVDPTPLLLIHGEADRTTPVKAARRLAALVGPACELWTVPGAEHSRSHATDPGGYEARVSGFLRRSFAGMRGSPPIIAGEGEFPAR